MLLYEHLAKTEMLLAVLVCTCLKIAKYNFWSSTNLSVWARSFWPGAVSVREPRRRWRTRRSFAGSSFSVVAVVVCWGKGAASCWCRRIVPSQGDVGSVRDGAPLSLNLISHVCCCGSRLGERGPTRSTESVENKGNRREISWFFHCFESVSESSCAPTLQKVTKK